MLRPYIDRHYGTELGVRPFAAPTLSRRGRG